jgi:hypothetical protein
MLAATHAAVDTRVDAFEGSSGQFPDRDVNLLIYSMFTLYVFFLLTNSPFPSGILLLLMPILHQSQEGGPDHHYTDTLEPH